MIHTILFTRENEPDVNAILTLSSDAELAEVALRQFHRALYRWLTTTVKGNDLCEETCHDFNIGDYACYDVSIPEDPTFRKFLLEEGVQVISLASADYRATYDRVLCSEPDPI